MEFYRLANLGTEELREPAFSNFFVFGIDSEIGDVLTLIMEEVTYIVEQSCHYKVVGSGFLLSEEGGLEGVSVSEMDSPK